MKIKEEYIIRKVVDCYIVIATGDEALKFDVMINLNETGAFLWQQLKTDKTRDELVDALFDEYEVERSIAEKDTDEFIKKIKEADLLVA